MSKVPKKEKKRQKEKDEHVLTPGGWRPKSKVHQVEPGQHVAEVEGHLRILDTATGKIIKDLGEVPEVAASEPTKRNSWSHTRTGKRKQTKKK